MRLTCRVTNFGNFFRPKDIDFSGKIAQKDYLVKNYNYK